MGSGNLIFKWVFYYALIGHLSKILIWKLDACTSFSSIFPYFPPKPKRAYPFTLPPTPKRNFWPTTWLTSKLIFSFFSFRSQEEISFQHLFFYSSSSPFSFLLSFFSFRFRPILNLLLGLLLFPLRFVQKKEFHSNFYF